MRTCVRSPDGSAKYGCQPIAIGSASLPTLWATMLASTASALSVMVMSRSVFEGQCPPKSPA